MAKRVYVCSECNKEFSRKDSPPKVIMNFRQQPLLVCPSCTKPKVEEMKKEIKVSAQIVLPGGYFGV